jgi:hypothetical protein
VNRSKRIRNKNGYTIYLKNFAVKRLLSKTRRRWGKNSNET